MLKFVISINFVTVESVELNIDEKLMPTKFITDKVFTDKVFNIVKKLKTNNFQVADGTC